MPWSPVQLVRLAHGAHLVLGERHRDLAGHVEVGVDPVPGEGPSRPAMFSAPEPLERGDLVGPAGQPLGEPVGQRRRDEPAVAPRRRDAEPAALQEHDVARRVVLLGLDRRPEPGEAAADDDEVGPVTEPVSAGRAASRSGRSVQ